MKRILFFFPLLFIAYGFYSPYFPYQNVTHNHIRGVNNFPLFSPNSQTIIIDSTTDGGFENGSTFTANGWTAVNNDSNIWRVGTKVKYSGTYCAYIGRAHSDTNLYTTTYTQVSHFYRDVTFTVGTGEHEIYLKFRWKSYGEASLYDYMAVYLVPTDTVPVAGRLPGSGRIGSYYYNKTAWQYDSIKIDTTGNLDKTKRLVFSWKNDNIYGYQPPVAIDNISLTAKTFPPLTGTKTIKNSGGDFSNFSSAIYHLNTYGIGSGGVTFLVESGETFNESAPLNLTATGTSSDKIVFKRNGTGAKPIVNVTGTSGTADACFKLNGSDYITFDSLDIRDAGSSSSDYAEYGFYFVNATSTDGCLFDTVSNCTIKLHNANTNSKGIYLYASGVTSFSGTNSNNKFLNDSVINCYKGYSLSGYSGNRDTGNHIGTSGSGRSIVYNIGGGTSATAGIEVLDQTRCKIYNTIIDSVYATDNNVYGIYFINYTADVYSNEIKRIRGLGDYSNAFGIKFAAMNRTDAYKNKISDISADGTDGEAVGIFLTSFRGFIYNNVMYNLRAPASGYSLVAVKGIHITGTGTDSIFHNTVYLNYTSASASNTSAGIYVASSVTSADIRNNIFVNAVNVSTGTRATAFHKSNISNTYISANTNNNLYYTGTPSSKNLIYYDGTNSYQTIGEYITFMSPKDSSAFTENPHFKSTVEPYNLDIDSTYTTKIESGGRTAYYVTADIDGLPRYPNIGYPDNTSYPATAPDAGAYEFGGVRPLTGTKIIKNSGGDYTNLTSAIAHLNAAGVESGGVTFLVESGETFNEPAPLVITATGTSIDRIVFKRNGTGARPIINVTGTSSSTDGCLRLNGSDYITFDSLEFRDAGSSSSDYANRGIILQGASASDGCQNDTVRNCIVVLRNNLSSAYGVYLNSTATSFAGTNSNNKFLNDSIVKCYYGYYINGSPSYRDTGNVIGTESSGRSSIYNLGSGTASSYGILVYYQNPVYIFNNDIDSITTNASNIGSCGIYLYGNTKAFVYSNHIHNLSSSGSSAYPAGIFISTGTANYIYGNEIHNVSSSASNAFANGIDVIGGTTNIIYNNIIYDIKAPSSTMGTSAKGISLRGGTTDSVFHNTVYLDYTSTSASNTSAALYIDANPASADLRNNIFVNKVNVTTGLIAAAFIKSTSTYTNISTNSNNNLYYAGTPGPKNFIFYDNTNADTTINQYIARLTPRDASAFTENPHFLSVTAPYNLNIDTAYATLIESGGRTAYSVTTDFDGTSRCPNPGHPVYPGYPPGFADAGAYEFGGKSSSPLRGIYTIKNSGGSFNSFSSAISMLNSRGVGSGGVTFLTQSGETFNESSVISITVTGTASNPIAFRSSGSGAKPVINITGTSSNSNACFSLNGSDYITFDSLDIRDAGTTSSDYCEYGFYFTGVSASDGCQSNTVKNCRIKMNINNNYSAGIYFNSTANVFGGTNSNNNFLNDSIVNCNKGYYLYASTSYSDSGNIIGITDGGRSSIYYTSSSSANNIYGIFCNRQKSVKIFSTVIDSLRTSGDNACGIICYDSNSSSEIYSNVISNLGSSKTFASGSVYGINIFNGISNYIYGNEINNIYVTSGDFATGLKINSGNLNIVYNNVISGIKAASSGESNCGTRGIDVSGGITDSIFHNTVYLDFTANHTYGTSAALYIASAPLTVDLRNNIFINKADVSSYGLWAAAFYMSGTNFNNISANTDNNLYYAGTPSSKNFICKRSDATYREISDYKTAISPKDSDAVSENTRFISSTSPYDLRIDTAYKTFTESGGRTALSITTDMNGIPRYPNPGYPNNPSYSATAPDIGAYESGGKKKIIAGNITIKNSGGDYSSFRDAIFDLNMMGSPPGGVTFLADRGSTFNETSGLTITASGTASSPVTFKGTGTGNKTVVSVTGTSGNSDACFKLSGSDYMTFDSLDIRDAGTSSSDYCEYGFQFSGASASDGCQNNTVSNTRIQMKISNWYSRGVFFSSSATSFSGTNSNNYFYNDSVTNCNAGYYLIGASVQNDTNNVIGVTGGGISSVYNSSSGNKDTLYGVYANNQKVLKIFSTNFDSIKTGGTCVKAVNIYGNLSDPQIFSNRFAGLSGNSTTIGIYVSNSSGNTKLYSNEMYFFRSATSSTGINILNADSGAKIYSNNIHDITSDGTSGGIFVTGADSGAGIYSNNIYRLHSSKSKGIYIISAGSGTNIYQNSIDSITSYVSAHGILITSGSAITLNKIHANRVSDIITTSIDSVSSGITISPGNAVNFIFNNVVYGIKAAFSDAAPGTRGISLDGGSTDSVFNNTVYLDYVSDYMTNESCALYISNQPDSVDLRNNIFVNKVDNSSGSYVFALYASYTAFPPISPRSNNNLYYSGTPSVRNLISNISGNSYKTIFEHRSALTPADSDAVTENPKFLSAVEPYDLKIDSTVKCLVESGGKSALSVTNDINGIPRYPNTGYPNNPYYTATAPDIGAYESGGLRKIIGGNLTIKPAGGDYSSFTEAINELNMFGPAAGGVTYLVEKGSTFNEPSMLELKVTGSVFSPIVFRGSGTGTKPLVKVSGTSRSDDICFKFNGSDYITFDSLEIADGGANANYYCEYGLYFTGSSSDGCSWNTIRNTKIRSHSGGLFTAGVYMTSTATVSSGTNSNNYFYNDSLLNCNSAYYFNGASGTPDSGNIIGTVNYGISSVYNSVNSSASTVYGIYAVNQNSIKIYSTYIDSVRTTGSNSTAICLSGTSINNQVYSNRMRGIYSLTSTRGIDVSGTSSGSKIYSNELNYIRAGNTSNGIYVSNSGSSINIYTNEILGCSANYRAWGIYITGGTSGTLNNIYSNKIYDISCSSDTAVASGIYLFSGGAVNNIYNNAIYDIKAVSSNSGLAASGLRITGGSTDSIFYNTVYLDYVSGNSANVSSSVYIDDTPGSVDLRNNIFINKVNVTTGSEAAAFKKSSTNTGNISVNSNNNLYYAGVPSSKNLISAFFGGAQNQNILQHRNTLAPKDSDAVTENPHFRSSVSPYDLRPDTTYKTLIESGGKVVTSITTDLTGIPRYPGTGYPENPSYTATAPDVGAYESGGRRKIIGGNMTIKLSDGDYSSFRDAIFDLNFLDKEPGGVTYLVERGDVFNENSELSIIYSGTQSSPVVFKASGSGVKPVINMMGTSSTSDACFKLTGADYFTFDSLDLRDAGTSSANFCEYGFYFTGLSGTDGCKYNTISNCIISTKLTNEYSRGIKLFSGASSINGVNSLNTFTNDSVRNCIKSYEFTAPDAYPDSGNVISRGIIKNNYTSNFDVYGVYAYNQRSLTIYSLEIDSLITNDFYSVGIQVSGNNSSADIYGNEISYLISTNIIKGIFKDSAGTCNINRNKIHGLINTSFSLGVACGIEISGNNSVNNIGNNVIYDLSCTRSSATASVRGISITGGAADSVFHNTVYLDYISQDTNNSGAALYVSEKPGLVDLRNNIFVNNANVTSGLLAAAFYRPNVNNFNNISAASNNNLYYAGTPSDKNVICFRNYANYKTIFDYRNAAVPRDSDAVTENPHFKNSSTPYDLRIDSTYKTFIESGGKNAYSITADFNGIPRYPNTGYPNNPSYSAAAPDIGAFEFGGIRKEIRGNLTIKQSGGDYSNVYSAVNELNIIGPETGGVTYLIESGATFNEEGPLEINVTGTPSEPIVFKRDGTGLKPVIKVTGKSDTANACFRLYGSDYITFDSLDVRDAGTSSSNYCEYGFYFLVKSSVDGCRNNIIRDCRIVMNLNNSYSKGIFLKSTATSSEGTNSVNGFYNDSVINCNRGYVLEGSSAFNDSLNVIGAQTGKTGVVMNTAISSYEIYGILVHNQKSIKIFSNIINTLFSSYDGYVYGIYVYGSAGSSLIYQNEIINLNSGRFVTGIHMAEGASNVIQRNKFYEIYNSHSLGVSKGICVAGGTVNKISNNVVCGVKAANSQVLASTRGISIEGGVTDSVLNNTVLLNFTTNKSSNTSASLYVSEIPGMVDLKNNIFVNKVNLSPGMMTMAFCKSDTGTANLSPGTDNNIYYSGVPSDFNIILYKGNVQYKTIYDYKSELYPLDSSSYTEDLHFRNVAYPYDLRIDSTFRTVAESGGKQTGDSTDINGLPRYPYAGYPVNLSFTPTAPDIGAYEFGGRRKIMGGNITVQSIGGDYSSIAAAMNDLKMLGLAPGGVNFLFLSGDTLYENDTVCLSTSGTVSDPIVFKKNGTGNKPVLWILGKSYLSHDAAIRLYGCDYVTFDSLDIRNYSYCNIGIYFDSLSPSNGCQNNKITNCDIGQFNDGCIRMNSSASQFSGTNSNNQFLNNIVSGRYYLIGKNTFPDTGNIIGTGAAAKEFLKESKSGSTASCEGIYADFQSGFKIFNQNIGNGSIGINTYNSSSDIYSNIIFKISGGGSDVSGISITNGSLCRIYNNLIDSIYTYGTFTFAKGIKLSGTGVHLIYNNVIRRIKNPTSESAASTRGISVEGNSTDSIFHNTVYLDYNPSNTNNESAALYVSDSAANVDIRNNIFVNKTNAFYNGLRAVAFYKSNSDFNNISANTNNNLYYSGIPTSKNLICYLGGTPYQTISSYKSAVSPKDSSAVSENPKFLSNVNPYDFRIDSAKRTLTESGGKYTFVNSDFNGIPRYPFAGYPDNPLYTASAPDIGAYESGGRKMVLAGSLFIRSSGGDYANFTDAISDLNFYAPIIGIGEGGVTYLAERGVIFSEPAGLEINVSGTQTKPIVFRTSGTGLKPILSFTDDKTQNTKGTKNGTENKKDENLKGGRTAYACITLYGCDYITFDSIDMIDTGSYYTGIEFVASGTLNGCSHNTISNCRIQKSSIVTGSDGIVWSSGATGFSGTFSFNSFLNDTIVNYTSGYSLTGSSAFPDSGNIISNSGNGRGLITNTSTTASMLNGIYGVNQKSLIITGQRITKLTSSNGSATGIYIFGDSSSTVIYNNEIDSINSLTYSYGINISNKKTNVLYKNKIHNINATSNPSFSYGICISGGSLLNLIYNNLIYNIKSPNTGASGGTYGMYLGEAATDSVFHNTVFLSYISENESNWSAALFVSNGCLNADLRNNIFVNKVDVTSGAMAVAFQSNSDFSNISENTDNNFYYAGTPGEKNMICIADGSYKTIIDYRTRISTRDSHAVTENPHFISVSGEYNLNIDTSYKTVIESGGKIIYSITDDYDETPRYPNPGYPVNPSYSAIAPDIGAYEFAGKKKTLSGTYTINPSGGDYPNFSSAITELNMFGTPSVSVTYLVTKGTIYNETAPLKFLTGGSHSAPVIFKADGTGSRPVINITGSGSTNDVCFYLKGSDYITIDSIEIRDAGTGYSNYCETGVSLSGDSMNGCNNNTISNCIIKLKQADTNYTYGILSTSDALSFPATNSFNNFINDSITGCRYGYYIRAYNVYDTNNVIKSFGDGRSSVSDSIYSSRSYYGIYATKQKSLAVSGVRIFNIKGINVFGINLSNVNYCELSSNEIYNINGGYNDSGTYNACGIYLYSCNVKKILKNKVYDIEIASLYGQATGIALSGAGTLSEINGNLINSITATYSPGPVYGISLQNSGTDSVFHNTVYLSDTSECDDNKSFCLYIDNYPSVVDLRNNIFINKINVFYHGEYSACLKHNGSLTYNLSAKSNNNLYYVLPGANCYIASDFFNYTTLASYKTAVAPRDSDAVTENPIFRSTINPFDFRIDTTVFTAAESGGIIIISDSTDLDNMPRYPHTGYPVNPNYSANAPDIGAYESGGQRDEIPPAIFFTLLNHTSSVSNRNLDSVYITDTSGVETETDIKPRIYYKKSTDSNIFGGNTAFDNGWKWKKASNSGSPFNFTIDYSIIYGGNVKKGDCIQYFVTAQDKFPVPNTGAKPSAGFSASSVSYVYSAPSVPDYYCIVSSSPLSGTYTIGLTAFNKVTGRHITFEKFKRDRTVGIKENSVYNSKGKNVKTVTEEYYIPFENGREYTGSLYFEYPYYNSRSRKTESAILDRQIQNKKTPDDVRGVYASISAAVADLNSNGVNGPVTFLLSDEIYDYETLPLEINISVNPPNSVNKVIIKPNTGVTPEISGSIYNSSVFKILATNYITIDGSNTTDGSTRDLSIVNTSGNSPCSAVWIASVGTNPVKNVNIKNCILTSLDNTISLSGGNNLNEDSMYADSVEIRNNNIRKSYSGIYVNGSSDACQVTNLIISSNLLNSDDVEKILAQGIYLQGVDTAVISHNQIGNIVSENYNTFGININNVSKNITIDRNYIFNIGYIGSGSGGGKGIHISSGFLNSNIVIKNNVISRIIGSGRSFGEYGMSYAPVGIYASGTAKSSGIMILNNSVYLDTNTLNQENGYSAGIALDDSSHAEIQNNNIVNNCGKSGLLGVGPVAISAEITLLQFTSVNYNNYYCSGNGTNVIGKIGSNDYTTLVSFIEATGQDKNSYSGNTGFISNIILLPDTTNSNCWNLYGKGMPLSVVSTDIRNLPRSTTLAGGPTCIGAFEFTTTTNPPVATASGSPEAGDTTYYTQSSRKLLESIWGVSKYQITNIKEQTSNISSFPNSVWERDGNQNSVLNQNETSRLRDFAMKKSNDGPNALPTTVNVQYFSGITPPDTANIPVAKTGKGYWFVDADTDPVSPYDLKIYWGDQELGNITDTSKLILAMYDMKNRIWLPFERGTSGNGYSIINHSEKSITVNGLTRVDSVIFALTDKDQPLKRLLFELNCIIAGFWYDRGSGYSTMKPDTITAIIRTVNPWTPVDSLKIFLDSSGYGYGFTSIANPGTGYYIEIIHRNSLSTWSSDSSTGFSRVSGTKSYNFSSAQTQAYGSNLIQVGTKWCIINGDVNRDDWIDGSDYLDIFNNYDTGGEFMTPDTNGDDWIDGSDYLIIFNNYDVGAMIPIYGKFLKPVRKKTPIQLEIMNKIIHKVTK